MNPIKAYTMLLIMLSVMMHNAYPHKHHQHEVSDAVDTGGEFHHHGHHGDHHHHSDKDDQDHEQNTFLDFLLIHHSHTQHTHSFTPATIEQVKSFQQLDLKVFGNNGVWVFNVRHINEELHRYVLYENFVPDEPYLQSYPHRGPPSLG